MTSEPNTPRDSEPPTAPPKEVGASAPKTPRDPDFRRWEPRLLELVDGIRVATRDALLSSLASGSERELTRAVAQGAGDITFGLDVPSETWIRRWHERIGADSPLSVLTEDSGWNHRGAAGAAFAHGGPRIAIDPVDGTRNLMADLRSAWTVVSFAPPGAAEPRLGELTGGVVSEIPGSRAARFRTFLGDGSTCRCLERDALTGEVVEERHVTVDDDDRVDEGYFPFFRYEPALRPSLARVERDFFARLAEHEGANLRSVYDDQYISNAGQLVLVLSGTYRMLVDARAWAGRVAGRPTVTSKPYDVGGAIVCARSAGAVVTAADGGELDFPMDARTPVDMAAFANAATHARLAPHLGSALEAEARRRG